MGIYQWKCRAWTEGSFPRSTPGSPGQTPPGSWHWPGTTSPPCRRRGPGCSTPDQCAADQMSHSVPSSPPSFAHAGSRVLGCRRRNGAHSRSARDSAQSLTITGRSDISSRRVRAEILSTVFMGRETAILRSARTTTVPRRGTQRWRLAAGRPVGRPACVRGSQPCLNPRRTTPSLRVNFNCPRRPLRPAWPMRRPPQRLRGPTRSRIRALRARANRSAVRSPTGGPPVPADPTTQGPGASRGQRTASSPRRAGSR